jgi:hypothetical protein
MIGADIRGDVVGAQRVVFETALVRTGKLHPADTCRTTFAGMQPWTHPASCRHGDFKMAYSGVALTRHRAMTPLRAKMIEAMQMHGYSPRTHESHLVAVRGLAKYTRRSSGTLAAQDLQRYLTHLVIERRLAPGSVRLAYNGIRLRSLEEID